MLCILTRGRFAPAVLHVEPEDMARVAVMVRPAELRQIGDPVEPIVSEEDAAQLPLIAGEGAAPKVPQKPGRKPAPPPPETMRVVRETLAPGVELTKAALVEAAGKHGDDVGKALVWLVERGEVAQSRPGKGATFRTAPPASGAQS